MTHDKTTVDTVSACVACEPGEGQQRGVIARGVAWQQGGLAARGIGSKGSVSKGSVSKGSVNWLTQTNGHHVVPVVRVHKP